eukprot:g22760.t1
MVRSMSQHLVKSGLTQETLESILCQKERVSLAGKLLEVLKEGKWEIKIVVLRRIRRGEDITFDYQKELMNLRRKETILGANSLSTSASSSSDVARPMTAPSSSSASSSSRVGRQKTAPSSTSASSFSKASPQKKAPSSTSASSFSKVALQKKAATSRTSTSVPDNWSQEKRADILSQPWLCDQKTLLVSMLTKYPFLDKKSKAGDARPDCRAPEELLSCLAGDLYKRIYDVNGEAFTQRKNKVFTFIDMGIGYSRMVLMRIS